MKLFQGSKHSKLVLQYFMKERNNGFPIQFNAAIYMYTKQLTFIYDNVKFASMLKYLSLESAKFRIIYFTLTISHIGKSIIKHRF